MNYSSSIMVLENVPKGREEHSYYKSLTKKLPQTVRQNLLKNPRLELLQINDKNYKIKRDAKNCDSDQT